MLVCLGFGLVAFGCCGIALLLSLGFMVAGCSSGCCFLLVFAGWWVDLVVSLIYLVWVRVALGVCCGGCVCLGVCGDLLVDIVLLGCFQWLCLVFCIVVFRGD